jgi:hypothetical protein
MGFGAASDDRAARVGLCAGCAHAVVQRSARGSEFWRCRRADTDTALRRYPPLPVRACHAYQPGQPEASSN